MKPTFGTLPSSVLDALDRPAREALRLQARPVWVTAAVGAAGAMLIALASLSSLALDDLHFGGELLPRIDLLRAVLESFAAVVPSAILLSAYFRVAVSPRVVAASIALGLLVAGVVVAASLPLMAYLTLFSRARPLIAPGAALPIIALAAAAATSARILRSIDPTARARRFAVGLELVLGLVFAARLGGM